MTKDIKNLSESIRVKLFNISKKENIDFNLIILRYLQESFLHRLSISKYKNNFLLKGGLLLITIDIPKSRPTVDVDFLVRKLKNEPDIVRNIFVDILSLAVEDGVWFDIKSVNIKNITEDSNYKGIRVSFNGYIGKIKKQLKIDLGFGDYVYPRAREIEYPSIFCNKKTKLKAYCVETIIAEKFEAMISLSVINSRMKDFYDIYKILTTCDINKEDLKKAIENTFKVRKTKLDLDSIVFNKEFYDSSDKNIQWNAFLRNNDLNISLDFKHIVMFIKDYIFKLFFIENHN